MNLQLNGKRALVTGSTAGIGLAIAEALSREGAHVIITGRKPEAVAAVVDRLRAESGIAVQGFAGDLTTAAAAEDLARQFPDVEILSTLR